MDDKKLTKLFDRIDKRIDRLDTTLFRGYIEGPWEDSDNREELEENLTSIFEAVKQDIRHYVKKAIK